MPQGSTPQADKPKQHKMLLKNPSIRFGICAICGPTRLKKKQYGWSCRNKYNQYRSRQFKNKKDYCESCGFIAEHRSQLDVDHIDGNHNNNDMTNLQTLCANCHRLKTQNNKDWESKKAPR
jgi:hypothetical protein